MLLIILNFVLKIKCLNLTVCLSAFYKLWVTALSTYVISSTLPSHKMLKLFLCVVFPRAQYNLYCFILLQASINC